MGHRIGLRNSSDHLSIPSHTRLDVVQAAQGTKRSIDTKRQSKTMPPFYKID